SDAWLAGASKRDNSTSTLWNASGAQLGNYPDKYNVSAAVSYVTGTHSIKVGFLDSWGPYKRWNSANADLYQIYNTVNVVPLTPFQVPILNTPLQTGEYLDANAGFYGQDAWRFGRVTLNYGLRYDILRQHVLGEPAQTGRFENSLAYDDIHL